jgi:hypothetical protein
MERTALQPPASLCWIDLIRAAVLAPSPDNNQPWQFVLDHGEMLICLDLQRTLPSDVESMFSLLALGSAIENVYIAAREQGHATSVEPCFGADPPELNCQPVARLRFDSGAAADALYPYLGQRCTCRKPYERQPIPAEYLEELAQAAHEREARVDWLQGDRQLKDLSRLIAGSDRIRLEYPGFHQEVYRQLRFSAQEAEQTRDGLDVRTLELPPGSATFLRFLSSWRRMRLLNLLGLSRILGAQSAALVRRSGAVGVLSIQAASPEQFLAGGRALQRVWLSATRRQLALHPLGSLPIFIGHEELLGGRHLSPSHRRLVSQLAARLRELVPSLEARRPVMLFRLGSAAPPTVRSLRRAAEEVIAHDSHPG